MDPLRGFRSSLFKSLVRGFYKSARIDVLSLSRVWGEYVQ